jgi:hypothetical protein
MRIGAFEIQEPLPEFKDLHAIALLHPWVDAGSVGTLALERLEQHLGATELGKLHRPGTFFDFTRYRPTSRFHEGERVVVVPNTNIYYAPREEGPDLLFIHLKEPHAFAERYIHSVVELIKTLGVKRYCRISGMYNAVPHTRPLRVTGSPGLETVEGLSGIITPRTRGGGYQGPTSIMNSVTEQLEKLGIDNINFMVHLPHYLSLDEDYAGTARLVQVLCALYNLPPHLAETERGETQYRDVAGQTQGNPQLKALIAQLEEYYDGQPTPDPQPESPPLAPDVEQFLREIGQKLEDN